MGWVAIWSAFVRDPVSQRSGIRWRRRDRRLTRLETNTFNGLAGWVIPDNIGKYTGVTAFLQRLTIPLTGRVVGRVGAHTGGPPLITTGEGFKRLSRIGREIFRPRFSNSSPYCTRLRYEYGTSTVATSDLRYVKYEKNDLADDA